MGKLKEAMHDTIVENWRAGVVDDSDALLYSLAEDLAKAIEQYISDNMLYDQHEDVRHMDKSFDIEFGCESNEKTKSGLHGGVLFDIGVIFTNLTETEDDWGLPFWEYDREVVSLKIIDLCAADDDEVAHKFDLLKVQSEVAKILFSE